MSTPPGNPQPGFQYVAPLPPKQSSAGCWKVAGLGCAALFLLGVVAVFVGGRYIKGQLDHSTKGGIFGTMVATVHATQDGEKIQKAIVAYHSAHGKYPQTLMTLVADGALDGKLLHNDLDTNPSPGSISWHYLKPGPDSPPTAPLLTEKFRITVPGSKPQTGEGTLIIDLDGKTSSATDTSGRPAS